MMVVEIKIDQYGQGTYIYPIFKLEIGNLGTVRDLGFGNTFCKYRVRLYRKNSETLVNQYDYEEWELEGEKFVPEHNRRDGAVELVRKACELFQEEA